MCVPYIYKLWFKPDNKFYIGSKAKNDKSSDPDMFWKPKGYFTTSKVVRGLIKEFGTSSDIWEYEILETFPKEKIKEVLKIEHQYIVKLVNEIGRENVLNKKWVENGNIYNNNGIPHTEETREKIKNKAKGKIQCYDIDGNVVRISLEEFELGNYTALHKGTSWYIHEDTKELRKFRPDDTIPDGFVKGQGKRSEEQKTKISNARQNLMTINNGTESKMISKYDIIPEGWVRGMVKNRVMPGWTEERRARRKITMDKKKASRLTLEGF